MQIFFDAIITSKPPVIDWMEYLYLIIIIKQKKKVLMFDVITFGSATIDVFAFTDKAKTKCSKNHSHGKHCFIYYPAGSKLYIDELYFNTGGGGTNTAVSFARLGLKTGYLGKLGKDQMSSNIIQELKKEKVSAFIVKGKEKCGFSIILDSIKHDRTILTHKGSNDTLKFSKVPLKKLKTKWFYFSSMDKDSFKTQLKLAEHAKKNGINIAYNPSSYLAEKGLKFLEKIIKNADVLVLNDEEASLLVGNLKIEEMLKRLKDAGPRIVVITQGPGGATAYDGNFSYKIIPYKQKVVETTGAGDAFASSFLAGMIKKKKMEFALQLALENAESVIAHHGAKNKLLTWKEALECIKNHPGRIIKKKI